MNSLLLEAERRVRALGCTRGREFSVRFENMGLFDEGGTCIHPGVTAHTPWLIQTWAVRTLISFRREVSCPDYAD